MSTFVGKYAPFKLDSNGNILVKLTNPGAAQTPWLSNIDAAGFLLNNLGTPLVGTDAANKAYVDMFVSGLTPLTACRVATTAALTATYVNGTAGVGATLTNAGAQAAISIDTISLSLNDRVAVKNQAAPAQNGIYTVTTVGSGATNWVLTRSTDFDTSAEMLEGSSVFITSGTPNPGNLNSTYFFTTSQPIVVGTTALNFALFTQYGSMANQNSDAVAISGGSVITELQIIKATYTNSESMQGGALVNIYDDGDDLFIQNASASSSDLLPANGVLVADHESGETCTVYLCGGPIDHPDTLQPGQPLYLAESFPFLPTHDVPVTPGAMKQYVGYAISETQYILLPGEPSLLPQEAILVPNVDNNISWDVGNYPQAVTTIATNTLLKIPTGMQAGKTYNLRIISSNGAQLIFQGANIYRFNINGFPVLEDGESILEFYCNGTQMLGTIIDTGYEDFTPIADSAPNTWYAARKGYTGAASNVTAATDFGSNGITGTKTGTGNIIITAVNGVDSFDFGSTNTDRVFSLGTPNISALMPGGVSTQMAVIKPSTTDNVTRSLFSFDNAFDNFYFAYNPSTNIFECWTFDNTVGGAIITGTVPSLGTSVTILTWVKNAAGNSYLYANSALVGTAVMLDSPDGAALVCEVGSFSSGSPMRGVFGDLIVWGRALSDSEREACELELMSIYGVV